MNFKIKAKVIKGLQKGKELGFPTANLEIHNKQVTLEYGIWACRVNLVLTDGSLSKSFIGSAYYGPNYAFEITAASLEVYIIDYDPHILSKDIYNQELQVEFCHRLRGVEKFASLESLVEQIHDDVQKVKNYFDSKAL